MSNTSDILSIHDAIKAFGGLRPLANKLNVAPSTAQGWKERNSIPKHRIKEIAKIAKAEGIALNFGPSVSHVEPEAEPITQDLAQNVTPDTASGPTIKMDEKGSRFIQAPVIEKDLRAHTDRRAGRGDRRKARDPNYKGPDRRINDRRTGIDRRQQRAAEWMHKRRFIERWMLTTSTLFFLVVILGVFLMAPEYNALKEKAQSVESIEGELKSVTSRLDEMTQKNLNISGKINEGITALSKHQGVIQQQLQSAEKIAQDFASGDWTSRFSVAERKIYGLSTMMDRIDSLISTQGGQAALAESLNVLKNQLALAGDGGFDLSAIRQDDPILKTVMKDVQGEDVKAAIMLMTLNKIRDTIGSPNGNFKDDLQLLQVLNRGNPETLEALNRLAPYAESGVLSTDTLQDEFSGLAGEIVMAKLQGQDASVQNRAMQRLSKLMTVRRTDDVTGESTDAIVARAQLKLQQNDIAGAVQELQKLDGASAAVAAPWLKLAQARLGVDLGTSQIGQSVIQNTMQGQNLSPQAIQGLVKTLIGSPSIHSGSGYSGL